MKRATRAPLKKLSLSLIAIASFVGTASPAMVDARAIESKTTITDRTRVAYNAEGSFYGASLAQADVTTVDHLDHPTIMLAGTALRSPGAIQTKKKPEPKPEPVIYEPEPVVQVAQVSTPAPAPAPAPAPEPTPEPEPVRNDDGDSKSDLPSQDPGIAIHWGGAFGPSRFGYGYCTEYVAAKRGGVGWLGNAKEWPANARAAGYQTGNTPVYGAILVTTESGWGHVAFVESVNYDNRTFTVSEQNYAGWNVESTRTLSFDAPQIVTFIY